MIGHSTVVVAVEWSDTDAAAAASCECGWSSENYAVSLPPSPTWVECVGLARYAAKLHRVAMELRDRQLTRS